MSSIIGVLTPEAYQELEHDEIFSEDQLVIGQEIYIVKRERLVRATILDANEVFYTLDIFDGTEDEPSAVSFHTRELPLLVPRRTDDEVAEYTAAQESGDNDDTAASADTDDTEDTGDTDDTTDNDDTGDTAASADTDGDDIDDIDDIAALEDEPSTVDPLGEFVETDRLLECSTFSDAVWAVYFNEKQLEAAVRYAGWVGSDDNPAALTDKVDELHDTLSSLKVYGYNYAAALERLQAMIAKL